MKKVLIIGKVPQNEKEIADYNTLIGMIDDFGYEILSHPIEQGNVMDFGEYGNLFSHVQDSDLIIADISHPTIELGMQLKEADNLNKPIIALVRSDVEISHAVESIPTVAEILTYENIGDVKEGLLRNFSIAE